MLSPYKKREREGGRERTKKNLRYVAAFPFGTCKKLYPVLGGGKAKTRTA